MDAQISLLWRLIALTIQLITNNSFTSALSRKAFVGALLDKHDYEKFRKIPPLELLVDTEDPAWVVCVCVGEKKRTEKRKGIRIFAERCWCHDYTKLHWRHASCLRPPFRLDMELPKPTRVLCIAFTYVSFFLVWLLYNEIVHSQIKLNNRCMQLANYRI